MDSLREAESLIDQDRPREAILLLLDWLKRHLPDNARRDRLLTAGRTILVSWTDEDLADPDSPGGIALRAWLSEVIQAFPVQAPVPQRPRNPLEHLIDAGKRGWRDLQEWIRPQKSSSPPPAPRIPYERDDMLPPEAGTEEEDAGGWQQAEEPLEEAPEPEEMGEWLAEEEGDLEDADDWEEMEESEETAEEPAAAEPPRMEPSAPPEIEAPAFAPAAAGDPQKDLVTLTVYAPERVLRGDRFLLTSFAHLFEQRDLVDRLAREANPDAVRQGSKSLNAPVARGQALQLQLSIEQWAIEEPVQTLVWWGQPNSVEWVVQVPPDHNEAQAFGSVLVLGPDGPLGRVRFQLRIDSGATDPAEASFAPTEARAFRHSYLAYASRDHGRVQALEPHFQASGWAWDPQQPAPDDPLPDWQVTALPRIRAAEVFVLFWSGAAEQSPRIETEWQVALGARIGDTDGLPEMLAVNLDPVAPPPPEELAFLPFLPSLLSVPPPPAETPGGTLSAAEARRLADRYVAAGDERVFALLSSYASPGDREQLTLLENSWRTLTREERIGLITSEQVRARRARINRSILALVGRLF